MVALGKVRSRVACALVALLALLSGCKHANQTRTLTFQQIFAEDSLPAKRGQRVVTSGVVVYSDPLWHLLLIQDGTGGIYMDPPAMDLHAGDRVQIVGVTADPGKFLEKPEFHWLSTGEMPAPAELASASQFTDYPTTFVRVPATVRWSGIRNGRDTIEAYAGDSRLTAIIFPGTSENLPRVGSEIKIAGVTSASSDSAGQFQEWRLLTPSPHYVQVVKQGPQDPFSVPLVRLSDVGNGQKGKLVHVSGKLMDRVSSLVFSDAHECVAVNLRKPLHGDFASADVVGFWTGTAIDDAVVRPTGDLLAHKGDIRSIDQLKHLSVAEALARRPVSVRGVVTYIDPSWGLMFIQDRTAAAFVGISGLNLRLKPGDLVDVSGVTNPGDYAPAIADPAVSFVGRGSYPQPLAVDPVESNLAMADSRWTSYRGVVHSVQVVDGHTNLKLGAGEAALNVQLPTLIDGERFLDKEISVTGALGILFNERRQAIGHQIFVPAPEFLSVVGSGGKPNPESTIAMLRRYSPEFDEHHSVGFRGQVVLKSAPNTVFVQDETAGIQVRAIDDLKVDLGDHVSVRGFLRQGEYSPAVEDAVVERESSGTLPQPERVSAKSMDEGRHDSEYVSMGGLLAAVRPASKSTTLVLNDNGDYFDVIAPASDEVNSLRLGSNVEVRGIFEVILDRTHVPYTISGFNVEIDSPKSIAVLKPGPWWDAGKVRWALLLFGLFASAAVLWATMLRRKVRDKTQALQTSLASQQKAQQFDGARNEILETIARNAPLPESMERLALAVEEQIPGMVCAVLLPSDGKSFLNGKPAPLFIAPGLPEDAQHSRAFADVLNAGVAADAAQITAVDSDLVHRLLQTLRTAGTRFVAAHSSPVFSSAGTVAGLLILFSKHELPMLSDPSSQNVLQSASRLICLARDHWQMHERLLHEARHDGLTGLPNRAVAEDRLEQALARADRRKKSFAVFCIDLDGFKAVNDELGHDAGDEVLRTVAVSLRGRIRHSDTLARIGGDEFLAIIDECASDAAARAVANSLIDSLKSPIVLEGRPLVLSASIGIAMYPADGQNAAQLKRNADQAMYRAKSQGGGQGCFWSREPETSAQATRKASQP